jgi:hypothetical protein
MKISRVYFLAVALVLLAADLQRADAGYDIMDPNGKITIKWDVVEWTGDGYRVVKLLTFQRFSLYV